jgi:hypothetical protein
MHQHFKKMLILVASGPLIMVGLMIALPVTGNTEPDIPFTYSMGMSKYISNCSACHGKWGHGTKSGPPLLHPYYKPSHHNDAAFYRAALKGVRAHHWNFGDMPPVKGIKKHDLDSIVPFIRWLQRANGV